MKLASFRELTRHVGDVMLFFSRKQADTYLADLHAAALAFSPSGKHIFQQNHSRNLLVYPTR